ncbi:MAG TPA: isoprenylcysteine carboxylmethyltransferase family protein [Verrucomicrobiae bacterium]|nr:isoprenylcysteine carboxylmethyltransferase family protein [Verrucomicrobiae bacterium]
MPTASDHIIIICWLTFIVYWYLSAQKVKTSVEKQSLESALRHRLPVGLGCWLLAYRKFPAPLNSPLTPCTNLTQFTGAAICVCGLLVTIWARRTLAGNWSSDVTFKEGHELMRTGPYRFVRHPIYTGLLLMCLGSALDIGQLRGWLGLLLVFLGFWIKLKQEETLLLRHFPGTYPVYRKEVKALFPFIL